MISHMVSAYLAVQCSITYHLNSWPFWDTVIEVRVTLNRNKLLSNQQVPINTDGKAAVKSRTNKALMWDYPCPWGLCIFMIAVLTVSLFSKWIGATHMQGVWSCESHIASLWYCAFQKAVRGRALDTWHEVTLSLWSCNRKIQATKHHNQTYKNRGNSHHLVLQ